MKKKSHTLLQILITSCFVLCIFILVGCSETNTTIGTLEMISNNMTKITNTLDNVKNIDNADLIISDFMDENDLSAVNSNDNVYNTSNAMNGYISKISSLNNSVISTIELNSVINNTKKQIYAQTSYIKALCNQNMDSKTEFSAEKLNSLRDLNNTIIANNTRINLSRNEITNNFNNVQKDQSIYSSNPEYLSSKYIKLKTSLNTRLSYFNNLSNSLDQLSDILCDNGNCNYPYIADDYIFEDKNTITASNSHIEENSKKTSLFKKNIDTYENAGTNMYGDYRNNPIYNKDNYLRNTNPGYGMGYGGYGMYGMPYGYNMGGYGMGYGGINGYGMPFNNGYIYPNINTFGTYKNIDTYRSREQLDKELEREINDGNDLQKDVYQYEIDLYPVPYPMPRPEPIPRPYPTQKPIEDKIEPDLIHKPMILPSFDDEIEIKDNTNDQEEFTSSNLETIKPDTAKNDEEQFVDKQQEPKIKKIVDGDWVMYRIEF